MSLTPTAAAQILHISENTVYVCLKGPLRVGEQRDGDRAEGDEDSFVVAVQSLIPGSPLSG